jgi:hypothetical protein
MLKQLLTGGSILALLLAGGFSAQAKPTEPVLQAQLETPGGPGGPTSPEVQDSSTTTPGQSSTDETSPLGGDDTQVTPAPGTTTTPQPDTSITTPGTRDADTALCRSFPIGSPTGGGTRQRLQAMQQCDFTYPRNF